MPHFFIILFKINLVLVLFAAAYYLVLRRLTFYVINRIFLLFGILFSTLYPFINLTGFFNSFKSAPAFLPQLNQNVNQFVQQESISFFWQILTFVFYAGVLFMASRLTIQFISLRRVHKNSNPGRVDEFDVRILNDEVSPFSFWQTIYVNPLLHKKEDLKNIIEHESVHVEEWHTLDIILAEISLVFYWFNPGVWLMKKAVRENIEFITDAKILKKGIDKKAYQYSLLGVGALNPSVAIVNNFNLSDLKKRIKMMNARRSSNINLARYLFILPILLITTLAFTIDKKDVEKSLMPLKTIVDKVIPEKKPEPLRIQVNQLKKPVKKVLQKPKFVDTTKNITLILNQDIRDSNSVHKILNLFLKDKNDKAPAKFKADRKIFISNFVFNDTVKNGETPEVRNIKITMNTDKDSQYSFSDGKRIINVVKVVETGNSRQDSLTKPDTKKHFFFTQSTSYSLDGNKVSAADLSRLDAKQIENIIISHGGMMDIKTKQK
ncbi:M56 family metallopeptidase [Pedobacter rhodius]|uniref:M56 family metallopeptidase n=1 Tax=Pedobacter rhodius TaxID=3004098 RepID=A0ABT4KTV0_9SPHI|nr:M56 family metallopeptidase [Pedobacter sp. SJ11]MCZ4222352.1 M56 family metallopeptidase [Pedobacter sp. SJ11]